MAAKTPAKYLSDFLTVAPLSHALWRSVEALSFGGEEIRDPVLDLGCGFGEFAGVVFGKLECGIDINKKDLKVALSGKRYRRVVEADARNLPFPNGKFSSVISVSVMEHIPNASKVIKEVNRVLKKDGFFIFSVPTDKLYETLLIPKILKTLRLPSLAGFYIKMHKRAFQHVTIRDSSWWESELEKSNFKIIKKQGTISPLLVKIHEVFLIFALPSQIWRWLFGKRLILFKLRSKVLPYFFSRFVYTDKSSPSNIFIVARKL